MRGKGTASPSQRLNAAKGKRKTSGATRTARPLVGAVMAPEREAKAELMRIRSKWLVTGKREGTELVDGALQPRWIVTMVPVYEPLSILDGQASVQGCADNRMFGAGRPEGEMVMTLASKAIADAYHVGRAYVQDHLEVAPQLRPLW